MKKAFLIGLFALLFCATYAQQTEVIRDSSWLINRSGIFFQARQQVQSNGSETISFTPLGDTSVTTRAFTTSIQQDAARLAQDAGIVSSYRATITDLIRFANTLPATLNRVPLDSIAAQNTNLYTIDYWQVNNLGIRFRKTAAGNYQWRSDTATVWRPFAFLGHIIRLSNFNGYTQDFFRVNQGNRYRTINRQYSLAPRATGGNRTAAAPVEVPEDEPPAPSAATLNANGTVTVGVNSYKYNSRNKAWVKI